MKSIIQNQITILQKKSSLYKASTIISPYGVMEKSFNSGGLSPDDNETV